MNHGLFVRLAYQNIKKDKNTFFPFLLSVISVVGVFYMLSAIWMQTKKPTFYGADQMEVLLQIGVWVTAVLSVGIIFYTNNFLMKRRTKELGLYNVLGMEKKHIGHVVSWELVLIGGAGLVLGLMAGMILSELMFLVMLRMMDLKSTVEFHLSFQAVEYTLVLFAGVFLADIFCNWIRILRLKPLDMMQSGQKGEKEPRVKWPLVLLGVICLSAGYYIAITTKNPIAAMNNFFLAVMLVIVGTYCLFVAVSILWLKMLKKNKNYYYHPTHFITIADMMHRMKQNAVGLANICIFSTAVLIVLSTTVSLYLGIEDEIRVRFPRNVVGVFCMGDRSAEKVSQAGENVDAYLQAEENIDAYFQKVISENNMQIKGLRRFYQWTSVCLKEDNIISLDTDRNDFSTENLVVLTVLIDQQYNEMVQTDYEVEIGKAIVLCREARNFPEDAREIVVGNTSVPVQKVERELDTTIVQENYSQNVVLLVSDLQQLVRLRSNALGLGDARKQGNAQENVIQSEIQYEYQFDLTGSKEEKKAFCKAMYQEQKKADIPDGYMEDVVSGEEEAKAIYAGLLFIGVFIGVLFLIATVLIIYYKQISEGYEDRNNFLILQKVGLGKQEVKKIVNSQMRMVFYLPILVAVVHITAAFPIVKKMLGMLNLTNVSLFVGCTIGTAIVFFLFYTVVYRMTSRVYYRIVNK